MRSSAYIHLLFRYEMEGVEVITNMTFSSNNYKPVVIWDIFEVWQSSSSSVHSSWYWFLSFYCFEVEEAKVSVVTPIDTNDDDIDDDDNVTLKTTSLQLQSLCSMPGHMCGSSTKHQSMMTMSCILAVLSSFSILL